MIKNILVPIDYSEASFNALETAINIAVGNNSSLLILHVDDMMPGAEESYSKEKAKEVCDAICDRILIQHGIQSKFIITEGIIGNTIVKTVLENKIDLIIMGSHGVSGVRELFIGSNSYYVVKRSSCPVLLIPEGRKWHEFNNILFPVRPTVFSFKLYPIINDIVKQNKRTCMIQIFGISTDRYEKDMPQLSSMVQEIKNKKTGRKIDISFSVSGNINISEGVLTRANEIKADLIIISSSVDVTPKPYFVGPFSQRIIHHAKIPVLSILKSPDN